MKIKKDVKINKTKFDHSALHKQLNKELDKAKKEVKNKKEKIRRELKNKKKFDKVKQSVRDMLGTIEKKLDGNNQDMKVEKDIKINKTKFNHNALQKQIEKGVDKAKRKMWWRKLFNKIKSFFAKLLFWKK